MRPTVGVMKPVWRNIIVAITYTFPARRNGISTRAKIKRMPAVPQRIILYLRVLLYQIPKIRVKTKATGM